MILAQFYDEHVNTETVALASSLISLSRRTLKEMRVDRGRRNVRCGIKDGFPTTHTNTCSDNFGLSGRCSLYIWGMERVKREGSCGEPSYKTA